MRKARANWVLTMAFLAVLAVPPAGRCQEEKSSVLTQSIIKEHAYPVVGEFRELPKDVSQRQFLETRMRRWGPDDNYHHASMTEDPSTNPTTVIDIVRPVVPGIIVGTGVMAVLATVTETQPYFSFDESTIWTRFEAQVKFVPGRTDKVRCKSGDRIFFERAGGAIRRNGRTFTVSVQQYGYPRVGEELILFLRGTDVTYLELEAVYLVKDHRVFPLDRIMSTEFAGIPLSSFIPKIK